MTIIQELYICIGIFAMIILAIQLVLIFFGPERKETHDKDAKPFALRSITAYISIFGWTAFIFTFYTLDFLAFFGGLLVSYLISLLVLIIFRQDFMDAFEDYARRRRQEDTHPKQMTMDELLKEHKEEKVEEKITETVVVKELTYVEEVAPIIVEAPIKIEPVKEEAVIIIKEAPEEIEIPEIVIAPAKKEKIKETKIKEEKIKETKVEEKKAEEKKVEPKQKETVVTKTTVTKKAIVKKEEKLTAEEQEVQDLLRRLKGEKAAK